MRIYLDWDVLVDGTPAKLTQTDMINVFEMTVYAGPDVEIAKTLVRAENPTATWLIWHPTEDYFEFSSDPSCMVDTASPMGPGTRLSVERFEHDYGSDDMRKLIAAMDEYEDADSSYVGMFKRAAELAEDQPKAVVATLADAIKMIALGDE